MKLIHLYIENFGGLQRYELDFSDGLTVLREENGFGKTTLAEFIRAMFYGFPRKAKTLEKSRRQKYTPWQGGKFGGNLTFRLDGKDYRIERTFGATPRGDHFQVIDLETGRKTDRFTEEIGLEIFGLDADSFERSTYMPQYREGGSLTTDSIRAKLGDLVEDTGDVGNFEKAITALKARRSSFIPYRGSGGAVAEAAGQITLVQNRLDRMEEAEKEQKTCREEIARLEAEYGCCQDALKEIRNQITLTSEMAAIASAHQQYRGLENRKSQLEAQLDGLRERYPGGIPGAGELEAALAAADRQAVLEAQQVTGPEDLAAVRIEEENRERFRDGVPTQQELEACRQEIETYRGLRAERKSLETVEDRKDELQTLFASGALEESRLGKLEEDCRELDKLRGSLENLAVPAEEALPAEVPKGPMPVVLAVLGLLAVAAGIVLLAMGKFIPGGVVLGLGLVALAGAAIGGMKAMMARELARQRQAQAASDARMQNTRKREMLEAQIRTLEDTLTRELGRGDFHQALMDLRMARQRYLDRQARNGQIREKQTRLDRELAELERVIVTFLGRFYEETQPEDFHNLLTDLQRRSEGYLRAKTTIESWNRRKTAREQGLQACGETLRGFFETWQLVPGGDLRKDLQQLRDDGRLEGDLHNQLKRLSGELEAFRQAHEQELSCPVREPELDGAALKQEESRLLEEGTHLTRQLLQKRQQAQDLRNQVEQIPALQDQLELWQTRKTQGQKNAGLLDDTMDFLQRAKDSLSGNYMGPIQQSFRSYLTALGREDEKFLMTPDLDIQLERQGQSRELGYFSAGQADLVMLCMRFALVDALFTGEKPVVILDDPFVNLDDRHTEEALALLKELAKERQILYLTCNSSRTV